jgi:hypothetical protein
MSEEWSNDVDRRTAISGLDTWQRTVSAEGDRGVLHLAALE